MRPNAYAASADRNTATDADTPAITMEFRYQYRNAVPFHSFVKLPSPAPLGTRSVDDSVPTGLSAADSTNTMGNSENATASTPTACRHPTRESQPTQRSQTVTSTPPPAGGYAGS